MLRASVSVLALWAALGVTVTAQAQDTETPGDPRVVRAYFDDPLVAAKAVISLDALESEYEKGYIVLLASAEDIEAARQAGMRIVEDDTFSVALPAEVPTRVVDGTIAGFSCYRTVEETYASAQAIVDTHPQLAAWTTAGESWKKEQNASDGYDLKVLRLTNSATSGAKPALFITTALHPREYATAELSLRFAERLADAYETDADVRWLLDHQKVDIMLQANPDGRKRAEEGLLWRKNHNTTHCSASVPGVDLNRNFRFKWGVSGSSTIECSEVYRGTAAASEPETQAVAAYMAGLFPDARGPEDDDAAAASTSGIYLDIHSHGRLVVWPWGWEDTLAPNGTALQTLGRKLSFFNGHLPHQAVGLYPASGATDDHAYGELGIAAYTYEIGTTFFQSCSYFEESILDDNIASLLYAFKVTRTPYLTPVGPDANSLSLSDGASTTGVVAGTSVTLSATLDDTRYQNSNGAEPTQPIAAGEYYVDVPPWVTGAVAIAMSASDGTFDSTSEDATATVDTTGLSAGRHTVFVRAKDSDSNWGAVSAVFLFVGMAPPATLTPPTLEAGDSELTVAWTPPNDNGASITENKVRYRRELTDLASSWSIESAGTSASHTITGLTNGKAYEVQVRAINAVGGSLWSALSTGTPSPPPPPPNQAPMPVGSLVGPDLQVGDGTEELDVSGAFEDPDSDTLTYDASSSAPGIAQARTSGSRVTLTPVAEGTATITVTATDVAGSNTPATQTFDVRVKGRRGVTISRNALTVDEGSSGSYTVVLDSEPTGPVTVTPTAPANTDVSVDPMELTFTTGDWSSSQTVSVAAATDTDAAADPSVAISHQVSGSDYGSVLAASVLVTIVEADTSTLSVEAAAALESDSMLVFRVTLNRASGSEVTVDYATSNGSRSADARAGSDYTAARGTLTFPVGMTAAQQIVVNLMDDTEDEEEEETFRLTLSNAQHASLAGGGSTLEVAGTIRDDDDPEVAVSFGSVNYGVTEGGTVTVVVRLNRDPERDLSIDLERTHHGGAADADYSGVPPSVAFGSGVTTQDFLFAATDDSADDDGEAVVLGFGSLPSRVTAGGVGETTLAIGDNDGSGGSDPVPGGGGGGGGPPPSDDEDEDDGGGAGGGGGPPPPSGPPKADFTLTAACPGDLCRARTGVPVTFEDTSTGRVESRRWDFGDGTGSRNRRIAHAWAEPGFYEVTLTVSDGTRESIASRMFLVEASDPAGTCVADAETLCLQDSRYSVAVEWRTADGKSGAGSVVHEGTNDSGLFTFFSADNWEVLIKVLDGCTVNGHVWVYGASTTDLGYSIRVTDTATGTVQEYRNEPGHPAPAITDAVAFPEGCRP